MILDYVGGVRGIAKDDDGWCWERGYVSFPLDYYKLCQNMPIFYVKFMIFLKATIFIFITVTSCDKKVLKMVYISYSLVCISYVSIKEFRKKMTSSLREGGRGQPKDDSGLCGGRGGGLKPPKKGWCNFLMLPNVISYQVMCYQKVMWYQNKSCDTIPSHVILNSSYKLTTIYEHRPKICTKSVLFKN